MVKYISCEFNFSRPFERITIKSNVFNFADSENYNKISGDLYEVLIEFDVNICDVLKMYKSYALITININRLNCNGFVTNKGINFM